MTRLQNDSDASVESSAQDARREVTRRDVMRLLAAASGAALGSFILPVRWSAPRLEFGLLPAHAACSASQTPGTNCCYDAAPCATGGVVIALSSASPAVATFTCTPAGLATGADFQITYDSTAKIATIKGLTSNNTVSGGKLGTMASGTLTYTPDSSGANTVNLLVSTANFCSGNQTRVTVDILLSQGNAQVYHLSSPSCSFN